MKLALPLIILLSGGPCVPLPAQSAESPGVKAPTPPLTATVPPNSRWTVTYDPTTPEKEPATADDIRNRKLRERYSPRLLSKLVLKGTDMLYIASNYEGGLQSEAWAIRGTIYQLPLREGEAIEVKPHEGDDFPELAWINQDNFRGMKSLNGRDFYTYSTSDSVLEIDENLPDELRGSAAPDLDSQRTKVAHISVETGLQPSLKTECTFGDTNFNAAALSAYRHRTHGCCH